MKTEDNSRNDPIGDVTDLRRRVAHLEELSREYKRSQAALKEIEASYRSLVENIDRFKILP